MPPATAPRHADAWFAGTVTLPKTPSKDDIGRLAVSIVDFRDDTFRQHVTPSLIKANRQACKAIDCVDNLPGSVESDERLANVRPACCQAALDIDEPLYALSEIFAAGEHDASYAHHPHGSGCAAGRWMALGTAVAACVAILYGRRNYAASNQTGQVLARMRGRFEERLRAARPDPSKAPVPLPTRQALRNDAARIRCLRHAEATHRFSMWHGGVLQMANGALLLASIALPVLAPVATFGMVVFCGLQARRFVAQRARLADPLPRSTPDDTMASAGRDVFVRRQAASRRAFRRGALAHGIYGAGAACLTLAAAVAGCGVLLWPGVACLTLGMVAVAATHKRSADHTFTSNSDADLGAQTLGGKASMLRQLALLAGESDVACGSAAQLPSADTRWQRGVRGLVAFLGACCGMEEQAQAWSHRRRVATVRIDDASWLARCIVEAGKVRTTALREEVAALSAKQGKPKHDSDAAALKNTSALLEPWLRLESEWADTCERSVRDAGAMAQVALAWLMSRRWHEEVISSLYLCAEERDRQQAWWMIKENIEPQFNAASWLEALQNKDVSAQRTWGVMQAAIADYLQRRQVEVARERIDAVANHLGERFAAKNDKPQAA